MSRRTKILIAIGLVLVLMALGVFLYFFFRGTTPPPDGGGEFPSPSDELPSVVEPPTVLPPSTPGAFEPILRQLSKVPVAGAVLGTKGGESIVRYQERSTGNVYEIGAAGEGEKRLTNTTIPKVYEALWSKSGMALISRYVREGSEVIESFSAEMKVATGGDQELSGTFLTRGIPAMAVSPAGTSLFYLQEENGGVSGIRSDFSGGNRVKLWGSPVKEWLVSWPSENKILLLSKPSALADGLLILLDPVKGETSLLLRNIPGLTALMSPARPEILYSDSPDAGLALHIFDSATGKTRELSLTTLPEKCVFSKTGERAYCGVPKTVVQGSYPDSWYQGVIPFTDEVWSITLSSGTTERVSDISEKRKAPLDLVSPTISSDEKFLVFIDKGSETLWSLQMRE